MNNLTDNELIKFALISWRNNIQTGDHGLSLNDVLERGEREKIRMLNSDQQEFIIRLEELAETFK